MATKRKTASPPHPDSATRRVSSKDARVTFVLTRCSKGVYVERIETLGAKAQATHAMLVTGAQDLARNLETDLMRFMHPGLYHQVQQQVEEILDVQR